MKKFSKLFTAQENQSPEFSPKKIDELLKKHGQLDVIVRGGQRYFIAPHMHKNGQMELQGNSFPVLNKEGDQLQINYSDIVGLEF